MDRAASKDNSQGWVKRGTAFFRTHPKWQLDAGLLGLVGLLFAMNIPLLLDKTHLFWDTFNLPYQAFAVIYGEWMTHGQLPFWLPFTVYGMPDFFSVTCLSIVNFLFIGLGRLFNVQDTLALFKVSLVAEQLVSLASMYLLAGALFKKRWVVWVVCLAALVTFGLYRQIQLNFRQVYLLPLILFWLVQFFQRRRPEFLWLTGLSMLFALPGGSFYPLVIEYYAVALFGLVLLGHDLKILKVLFRRSWPNLAWFCGLVLVAGVSLLYFRSLGASGPSVVRRGADFAVSVQQNLNYWWSWSPVELGVSYFYGLISLQISNGAEYIYYIGLLPLAGVAAACLYQRRPAFLGVLAAGVFLYWYSLRGFLSAEVYYLPFVNVTRYIAILGSVPLRTFLILAAGFGLDQDLRWKQIRTAGLVLLGSALLLDVVGQLTRSIDPKYNEILANAGSYSRDFKLFLVRLAAYLGLALLILIVNRLRRGSNGAFGAGADWTGAQNGRDPPLRRAGRPRLAQGAVRAGIVLVLLLDLALFRINYELKLEADQPAVAAIPAADHQVQPLAYQAERSMTPPSGRTSQLFGFSSALQAINPYLMESYVQFDRCLPVFVEQSPSPTQKFEIYPASLTPLIDAGLTLYPYAQASPGLKQIYGCEFPKLRVVSNVLVSDSPAAALDAIKNTPDFSNLLVLSRPASSLASDLNNPPVQAEIEVLSFSANAITLQADLAGGKGGWLVYSDAYHPNWIARVNGQEVKIEQAYLGFKAVRLEPGQNRVEFQFQPAAAQVYYTLVVLLSALAALAALGGVVGGMFFGLFLGVRRGEE